MFDNRQTLKPIFQRNPQMELLLSMPLFQRMTREQVGTLMRRMTSRHWRQGAIIVGRDEPSGGLHIVVQGTAKRVLFADNGREIILDLLGPGEVFGEIALLDGQAELCNVVADSDCRVLLLSRAVFMELLSQEPAVTAVILKHLVQRLRKVTDTVGDLALYDVGARLSRCLVRLAKEKGEYQDDGILIKKRPTQQDLANMVGTCRETVSRALSAMGKKGTVVSRGRSLLLTWALVEGPRRAA